MRKLSTQIWMVVVCLLLLSCDKGGQSPSGNSSVKGLVLLGQTRVNEGRVSLQSRKVKSTVPIGSNGSYVITGLSRGDYTLVASGSANSGGAAVTCSGIARAQVNRDNEEVLVDIQTREFTTQTSSGGGGGGSCPYIYAMSGGKKEFCGDIYAGAVYQKIERDDYLLLPAPMDTQNYYSLLVTNELNEIQYTDYAKLKGIMHPANTEVLLDKKGQTQTLRQAVYCKNAVSGNGIHYEPYLKKQDQFSFRFNEDAEAMGFASGLRQAEKGKNELILTFQLPENASSGKLVVNAKNSDWFIMVWESFLHKFGEYYDDWNKGQKEKSAEELNSWSIEEAVPLKVYLSTENGWQYVDCFDLVGSMKHRKMVLPLTLSALKGKRDMTIKLESAFNFWELDYAAMDFSENSVCSVVEVNTQNPAAYEVIRVLSNKDQKYMRHETGDQQALYFKLPSKPASGLLTTYFLHSKGYYEPVIKPEGSPDYLDLLGFLFSGRMGRYSLDQYRLMQQRNYAVIKNQGRP